MFRRIGLGTVLLMTTLTAFAAGPFGGNPPKRSPVSGQDGQLSAADIKKLASVRRATAKYFDVQAATDAGYVAGGPCVPQMGTHYVNMAKIANPSIVPEDPEILLYDGDGHLVGVEYLVLYDGPVPVDTWDGHGSCTTPASLVGPPPGLPGVATAPLLFGSNFDGPMLDHGELAPLGVCHFDFHVWVWRANPLGVTAHQNPLVSCAAELD